MLSVTYYGALSDPPITEYLAVLNQGYAGQKANNLLMLLARLSGAPIDNGFDVTLNWLDSVSRAMNQARPPEIIEYKKDGKFFTLMKRKYDHATQEADITDSVRGQDAGTPSTSLSQLRLLS
jgi:DNA repair protein RadD